MIKGNLATTAWQRETPNMARHVGGLEGSSAALCRALPIP